MPCPQLDAKYIRELVRGEEARQCWPKQYQKKLKKLELDQKSYNNKNASDDANAKANEGKPQHISKIVEMFEAIDDNHNLVESIHVFF